MVYSVWGFIPDLLVALWLTSDWWQRLSGVARSNCCNHWMGTLGHKMGNDQQILKMTKIYENVNKYTQRSGKNKLLQSLGRDTTRSQDGPLLGKGRKRSQHKTALKYANLRPETDEYFPVTQVRNLC